MAELYHYKCLECNFEIMSTPWGGDVYGSGHGYYLYLCEECKHISEIEQGFTEEARKEIEKKNKNKLIIPCPYPKKFISDGICNTLKVCYHCGSTKLSRWKPESYRCPICGGSIIKVNDIIIDTD